MFSIAYAREIKINGSGLSYFFLLSVVLFIFFTEIVNSRDIQKVQSGLGEVFNPSGSIRKLEENLQFSDTFHNRVALADAYLYSGNTHKAIELYESSLRGAFIENEHVLAQLTVAYSRQQRYNDVINCAKIGADVMTGPLSSIEGLLKHPLTDIGLKQFLEDYKKGN